MFHVKMIIISVTIITIILTGYQECWLIIKKVDIVPGGSLIKQQLFG